MTRFFGKPVASCASAVISSSGLETTMMTASGEVAAMFSATERTILAFVSIRSMRLMPGLRGSPAVMTTTSEFSVPSYDPPPTPTILVSKPSIGRDWFMSSAMPSGLPSTMSVSTTVSKTSYSASRRAVVEP